MSYDHSEGGILVIWGPLSHPDSCT
jgi:hypothetical protein